MLYCQRWITSSITSLLSQCCTKRMFWVACCRHYHQRRYTEYRPLGLISSSHGHTWISRVRQVIGLICFCYSQSSSFATAELLGLACRNYRRLQVAGCAERGSWWRSINVNVLRSRANWHRRHNRRAAASFVLVTAWVHDEWPDESSSSDTWECAAARTTARVVGRMLRWSGWLTRTNGR